MDKPSSPPPLPFPATNVPVSCMLLSLAMAAVCAYKGCSKISSHVADGIPKLWDGVIRMLTSFGRHPIQHR
ncbi:hypothetical protein Tco_1017958 [Tanacetum coccineum]|uniref:Uncharacterized protein n=1 Tax=Tanacetum coccineum TaxID=301880 RepID=A0ABQ5FSY9_9ASTR